MTQAFHLKCKYTVDNLREKTTLARAAESLRSRPAAADAVCCGSFMARHRLRA